MPKSSPTWQFAWASLTGCRSAPTEAQPTTTSVTVLDWCSTSKLNSDLESDLVSFCVGGGMAALHFFTRPSLLRSLSCLAVHQTLHRKFVARFRDLTYPR